MAGYSGTPLVKKLGIKADMPLAVVNAPRGYASWLTPLPAGVSIGSRVRPKAAAVHFFTTTQRELERVLPRLRRMVDAAGFVWVSWPKQSSRLATDVTEDTIRAVALPLGFVDVKVCAVTDVWSGLKLVVRKSER